MLIGRGVWWTSVPNNRTVVSLFSGAGGFDWGFHQAGFATQLAVEQDKNPVATLAHNLKLQIIPPHELTPNSRRVVVHGDIRAVDFRRVARLQPDVLIGGPPCQDFSVMRGRKREGTDGQRGTLYREFLRALMFLQPRLFVFENVPGLISANDGAAYQTIVGHFENLEEYRADGTAGGEVAPITPIQNYVLLFKGVVDAPVIGVPQTRRRLIIVGMRADIVGTHQGKLEEWQRQFEQVMLGAMGSFGHFPLTTLEIFEGQPLDTLDQRYCSIMNAYRSLVEQHSFPQVQQWHTQVWKNLTFNIVQDYYAAIGLDYKKDYEECAFNTAMSEHQALLSELGWLGKPVHSLECPNNTIPQLKQTVQDRMSHIPPGENAEFVDGTQWSVTNKEISFIYRRSYLLKPAWTVMAYGGGGTYGYHYERERQQLTLRERARIQTFSDDFLFKGVGVRAQIGEAVPPLLGKRIATIVADILDEVGDRRDTVVVQPACLICPPKHVEAAVPVM